jgi:hypothetical protein
VKEAVANDKENMAQDCASWSNQTVSVYRDEQSEPRLGRRLQQPRACMIIQHDQQALILRVSL